MWGLGAYGWFGGSSGGITHPVGQKHPNDFGVYDMHGNVWEWCSDWADTTYYKQSPVNDPPGAAKGTDRVMRGGCWRDEPCNCRSAYLSWWGPNKRSETTGFRIARNLTAAEAESVRAASLAVLGMKPATTVVGVAVRGTHQKPRLRRAESGWRYCLLGNCQRNLDEGYKRNSAF